MVDAASEALWNGGADAGSVTSTAGAAAFLLHYPAVLGALDERTDGLGHIADTLGAAAAPDELLARLGTGTHGGAQLGVTATAGTFQAAGEGPLHLAPLGALRGDGATVCQSHAVANADRTGAISAGHPVAAPGTQSALFSRGRGIRCRGGVRGGN